MAANPNWGVRITSNAAERNLSLIRPNMAAATQNATQAAAIKAVDTMKKTVVGAVTRTGLRRSRGLPSAFPERPAWSRGLGPGRTESRRMINSINWRTTRAKGYVHGEVGFIDNPPKYVGAQELGTPDRVTPRGRVIRGIPPMLAFSAGRARFTAIFPGLMQKAAEQALRNASLGRRGEVKIP